MKILWLTSWYPNLTDPVLGDFIQRHAAAVSAILPLHLIHVIQQGPFIHQKEEKISVQKEGNLSESIYLFSFKPIGIPIIDKLRYQSKYLRYSKKVIEEYFKKEGKPDLIHVHVPIKAGLLARWALKKFGIPYIVSDHSSHYEKEAPDSFYNRSFYFRNNTKLILQEAALVTNVSFQAGNIMKNLFNLKKVVTVHNVVDEKYFYYKEKQDRKIKRFRFLHASSLSSQKNFTGILEALVLLKRKTVDWEIIVCGPFTKELREKTDLLGLKDFVIFKGEVPYKNVAAEMQMADALVLFSLHENFPCVVIEALSCGLPVISSKAGGVAEVINQSNGILVEKNEVIQLAESMEKIITDLDNYNAKDISEEALHQFKYSTIGYQFVELYEKVLEKR